MFAETVTWSLRSEKFPDLVLLIDICGTFQASSADYDHGFSLMNLIWIKSRDRHEVKHLDQMITESKQAEGPINFHKVYNYWKGDKDRREKI